MIGLETMKKIETEFSGMNAQQIAVVPLLASERMWLVFQEGLHPQYKAKLEHHVRSCLDIMWECVFEGKSPIQEEIYQKNLNTINDLADENDPDAEFTTPFPFYLIDQLFSGILDTDDEDKARTCAAATVRALDMICDNLFDQIDDSRVIDTHQSVLSELNRIENDIMLAKNFPLNISQIIQIRDSYRLLRLVPITI